ncbi:MAG: B12-binding domain-containing radical SAM protein [Candidatus Marinimicrobia bacterium]|nr:B12-binding domain-containing radical SAM protein [Candidatus Neomarinimicrobiota bacterium]|tara:strand:+ start:84413 stop:85951 length:1539 start_codon:yes stop_codon:yes gene_type:complete
MAKVLFINPRVREEDVPRHVPYGIALLASIVMEKGHSVQIYDENAWRKSDTLLKQVLKADDWDVIALGGITTAYGSIKKIVGIARDICPKSKIVLGGGVLTSLPQEIMFWLYQVDIGVIGEAFNTFPELLDMIDRGGNEFWEIPGTITTDKNGHVKIAPIRELIEDLDSLPYPAWDLFPLEEIYFPNSQVLYSEEGMLAKRRLDINASYGCSLICRYCYHLGISGDMRYEDSNSNNGNEKKVVFDEPGNYTRNIRYHSPEYITEMAKYMYDKYKIDFIGFLDENLMTMDKFSGRTWMKGICEGFHEKGLAPKYGKNNNRTSGVHWSGTSHATLHTPEILKTMRKAGCSHLVYGYESFSPHVMKTIGKGATPKTNIRSFFNTLEAGIRPIPNQIIGFPNEDFESIYQNMEAWKTLGIVVKPFFATPYPGSEWFTVYREQIVEQYGGNLEEFILSLGDATSITAIISHNFNAVELLGLREMMVNDDIKGIRNYEKIWRSHQNIADGKPSTIFSK